MSSQRKRDWVEPVWRSLAFWFWLIVSLIVYFALRASGLSSIGSFLIALGVEVAGQIALWVLVRTVGVHRRDRAGGPQGPIKGS